MKVESKKLQAKDLINVGVFYSHLFCHFLCRHDAGVYPDLYPAAWTGVSHPVRDSLYAVLNKGQESLAWYP